MFGLYFVGLYIDWLLYSGNRLNHIICFIGKDWGELRKMKTSPMHIIQPMGYSVLLQKCMIQDPRLPKYVPTLTLTVHTTIKAICIHPCIDKMIFAIYTYFGGFGIRMVVFIRERFGFFKC